ncbi:hypothetical protein N7519_011112, partial [Penicillium mononematosum]|uniref:uncharacterized protein n=1 Tax=Penicillium mononematosum TaxID=268346 RepID=UPI0025492C82
IILIPEQLTILLDHIHKLSGAVEEIYETSYHKPLALNNLELPWDSQSSLEQCRSIITYLLVVGWVVGLYLFVDQSAPVPSQSGTGCDVVVFSSKGVVSVVSVPFWGHYLGKPRVFVCRFDTCEGRPMIQSLGVL